jgi:hypothetical protein
MTYAQQPVQKAVDDKNLSLDARYKEMKSASQTFKDYKVIKETVLDKVWKIATDTIAKTEQQLVQAQTEIDSLKEEVSAMRKSMSDQEASIKDVVYDSTHISLLGIPFLKSIFILLVAAIIVGLAFLISLVFARMKIANSLVKEKTLIADSIAHEFEEFKKRSMEKHTKLSRELQNERNKWQEYRKM